MQVIWDRLYSTNSSCDKGTLYQLRNLLSQSSVGADPSKSMKAFEDFLVVVLSGYVITAAKTINSQSQSCVETAKAIVSKWVKITLLTSNETAPGPATANSPSTDDDSTTVPGSTTSTASIMNLVTVPASASMSTTVTSSTTDPGSVTVGGSGDIPSLSTTNLYTIDLFTLGLLWYGFHDAVKEGDSTRILLYWKFLLLVFKLENHHNYAKEAFNLTLQSLLLSTHKLCELKWSRTINTHGKPGHNVPCDLHMEHLNKQLKGCIRSAGSNIYPSAIQRVAKSLGPVSHVCSQFEKELSISVNKEYHTYPSFKKDLDAIVRLLKNERT